MYKKSKKSMVVVDVMDMVGSMGMLDLVEVADLVEAWLSEHEREEKEIGRCKGRGRRKRTVEEAFGKEKWKDD